MCSGLKKTKYKTASSVAPDFARFRLIHPDIYTPSPVWTTAKNYPSMKDKYFQVAKVIAPPMKIYYICEFCGKIFQDRLEHHVYHCGHTNNERDTF